jgi:hypothetical protein
MTSPENETAVHHPCGDDQAIGCIPQATLQIWGFTHTQVNWIEIAADVALSPPIAAPGHAQRPRVGLADSGWL